MPTLEINERNIDISEEAIKKLEKFDVLEIENKVNPLLMDYNLYRLRVDKLIDQFISQSDEIEKLLEFEGSLTEYKILKIIKKFGVASPKLIHNELEEISKPWINRLLNRLQKGFIKKIEKGLYQLDKKGEELIR